MEIRVSKWIERQKAQILKRLPGHVEGDCQSCLYCQRGKATYGSVEITPWAVYRRARCTNCKREWTVIYRINGVIDDLGSLIYLDEVAEVVKPAES